VVTTVAKKGDDVIWNDVVRTDKGGRARITLLDQSILSVGSQAELRIIKHDAKSQQTSIEVGYGRVRMEVTPVTQPGGSFEVKTPTAVAGVIGTTLGVDSTFTSTSFLCISGKTWVSSNVASLSGQVPCPPGTVAVVAAGKAPVTRPATQQEIQQFTQDTEPAVISAMAPDSLAPGSVTDAVITGTQLGGITQVSSSNPSVTVSLNPGGTTTSVTVHVTIAANAAPGPATITLAKPTGAPAAAVFTIVSAGQGAAQGQGPSIKTLSATTAPPTGGVPVTITGTNFDASTKVMFGNVAAANVTFVSSTQLNVVAPPASPGTVDITVTNGSGLTSTLSGGFSFGGPVPAISPPDITVNPGVQVALDGSRSSDTLAGTTITYNWTLCAAGFKPPQVGTPLAPINAPVCNPAAGTVAGTDSQFSFPAPAASGPYFARLQVTDNLGASAVIFTSVTVTQPTYDDPATRMIQLAQAFSTLQPQGVLAFFDPTYPNLTSLQNALQHYVKTLRSLTANVQIVPPNITGNTAVLEVTWQGNYSYASACQGVVNCQPPTNPLTATVNYVMTLTPGKGWFITQGPLPSVPDPTASLPELQMVSVVAQGVPGNPIPVAPGAQTFVATVKNIGTAASTQTTVHFALSQLDGTPLGSADGTLAPLEATVGSVSGCPAPFPPGSGCGTATGTITVPNLTAVTHAQLVATANPGCTMVETTCGNDAGTFQVVITPPSVALPNLVTKITNVSSGATLGTGPQTIQATVSNNGNAPFAASPPVNFAVIVAGNTVASTQVTITGPIAAGQVAPVQAQLNIPTTISAGTSATLSVDASPLSADGKTGCPVSPVETDCADNTASLSIFIGVPTAIIVTSSAGNTVNTSPLQLDGPLTAPLTLTATRSDNVTTGSVSLAFTGTLVTSTPSQLTSIPYATPEPVDFAATIDASGNVTTGQASVTVTPSNATPFAGSQPSTLFFNIGDIVLTGAPTCTQILPASQTQLPMFTITAVSGFNISSVNWQWNGLPGGVTVDQPSGMATLSGTTYSLPQFTFTNSNASAGSSGLTFFFAVTITNSSGGSATKSFALSASLSATACGAAVGRFSVGHIVNGTWTRGGFGGGMAKAAPGTVGPLPDLQLNPASVSFTPSIPTSGDTVSVRFRVTNAGTADAQRVPISLVVNGTVVASDTFDLRAGASTLAALEWTNASAASRSPQAAVVVDPNHTVPQKSTVGKSAPLAHFAFLPVPGTQTGMQTSTAAQRATLEVADGGCAGLSFASGGGSCGSADVEITVEQLASGHYTLTAQSGIADLGTAFGGGKLAGVQYQPEVQAVAGHSYAVQLGGGKTGVLHLTAIRNPAQTKAQGRQAFGASSVARNVGAASTGPVETGDVSGVRPSNQPKAYFEVSYQTQ
jgi:hypothetical protein